MKNKYLILCFIILSSIVVMSFSSSNNSKFYYAYNEKIILSELDNKLIVRYKQNKKSDRTKMSLNRELVNKPMEWKDDSTCIISIGGDEKELLRAKILNQTDVKTCNPVYAINTGLEMGVTDELLVKFNENVAQAEIDKLHKKYGVEVVKTTEIYQLLKVQNGMDALQIANIYQESGLTRFSHPNFYSEVELHQVIPNDTYFVNQFSLNNTGQVFTDGHSGTNDADIDAPEAWTVTTGNNNIVIAVLDQGLTSDHPDLPNTRQVRLNGSNFADGDANNPSPTGNLNHGNACAGIIGATQNNNQGISGIAPNCRIMPIRIFNSDGSGITPERIADAIDFARTNGTHIISNSWGYNTDNPNFYPVIKDAIIRATTQGRNNLGCVVVFSAGNNRTNNGYVHFPSNVDVAGVLTVGASDRFDLKSFYSPLGNPSSSSNQLIDLVAPSHRAYSCQIATETFEAWSIDIPGDTGYNPVHDRDCDTGTLPVIGSILPNTGVNNLAYTGRFGGTSYACPQVAGVAALMLSINPNLTQQQVFNILTSNADQVGGYTYTNGRSNEMGFGRLNACRAVSQVLPTIATLTGPTAVCSSGATFTVNNVPAGYTVTWNKSSNINFDNQPGNPKTFTASGTGSGWVQATIVSACGNVTLPAKTVWVGQILPLGLQLVDRTTGMPKYQFCNAKANPVRAVHVDGDAFIDNWEWRVTGGYITYDNPYGDNSQVTIRPISSSFMVELRAHNSCGWSAWSNIGVSVISCGAYYLSVAPNPATSEAAIELVGTSEEEALRQPEWELEVYTAMQSLKTKIQRVKGNKQTLNTSGWKEGVYIIRAKVGNELLSGKLVVKH